MNTQNTTVNIDIPNGYMQDKNGSLVPIDKVKPLDKIRDELVKNIIAQALDLHQHMQTTKAKISDEIQDFLALSANEYGKELGGKKGNIALYSYDGTLKVQIAMSDNIVFDERLQVAKQLIDECVLEWSDSSNDNIKALVKDVFQVDKQGKISIHRVLGLRRIDINDEKWQQAMQAINDSIQVIDTKEYIRCYQTNIDNKYQQISLDFANI